MFKNPESRIAKAVNAFTSAASELVAASAALNKRAAQQELQANRLLANAEQDYCEAGKAERIAAKLTDLVDGDA